MLTQERIIAEAKAAGFAEAALARARGGADAGRPVLVTAWPYLRAGEYGPMRISSFYLASQKAYLALSALEKRLNAAGLPARRSGELALKPLALACGFGVLGRNSLVIHERYGAQMVLGGLVLDLDLQVPQMRPVRVCADCGACRVACPGQALEDFARLERPRCLRAHMLAQGARPKEMRAAFESRLLGCDGCIESCPMNEGLTKPGPDEGLPELLDILEGDEAAFKALKEAVGSNFARKGRILAQALLVAGNSGDARYLEAARALTVHEDEAIAEHALWCAERLQNAPKA
ncbi:MAG: hypothetical protein LBD02_00430 [Christensenellaceae bacterium]|jgi:epoxyqueuosine reductase QueG|nr:hypothetical protein [Christensenellaceae bacterium]